MDVDGQVNLRSGERSAVIPSTFPFSSQLDPTPAINSEGQSRDTHDAIYTYTNLPLAETLCPI